MEADPVEGGTATDVTDESPYTEGTVVDILAVPDTGWEFVNWTSDAGGTFADANDPNTTFTMPGNDVTVTANFYEPVVDPDNSSASWTNNNDGTGSLTLEVRDQHNNPIEDIELGDIVIDWADWAPEPLDNMADPPWNPVVFNVIGDGVYEAILDTQLDDWDDIGDIVVDGVTIKPGLEMEIDN